MKIIKNIVKIDLKTEENKYLLINTLFGSIDLIDGNQSIIIDKWLNKNDIFVKDDIESNLFEKLFERKYLIENDEMEAIEKKRMLTKVRNRHNKYIKCSHSASFVLTYSCNFACPYCYEKGHSSSDNLITKEQVDAVFNIYENKLDNITLYGGEPLLLSNREIIEYIIERAPNAVYNILTNGYYLKEYVSLFNRLNISNIQVTLDGSKEIHDKSRILRNGDSTFDKIMEGIDSCLKNKINIIIRMNISNDNIKECLSLRDELGLMFRQYIEYLGFELQPIFQLDKETKKYLEKILYYDDYIIHNDNEEIAFAKNFTYNRMIKTCSPITLFLMRGAEKVVPVYCSCDAERQMRFYDADGDIYSCTLNVGKKEMRIGTYYPEYCINPESMIYRNIETVKECSECKYSLICGGGCPNGAIDEYGNIFHPNCEGIKNELYENIPKLFSHMKQ